jgi:hypothetical protein
MSLAGPGSGRKLKHVIQSRPELDILAVSEYEYMSMTITALPSSAESNYFQGFSARLFGAFIQSAREKAGLPVEPAAWLAGFCTEEWASLEAGDLLPNTKAEFQSIARALDIEWQTMTNIILMCRQAWGIQ